MAAIGDFIPVMLCGKWYFISPQMKLIWNNGVLGIDARPVLRNKERRNMTGMTGRQALAGLSMSVALLAAAGAAQAKGCLKGAAVGAVAGHVAGHHAVVGAAAGCAVGHHLAKKKEQQQQEQPSPAPQPQQQPGQPGSGATPSGQGVTPI
jgi:hypothetical protein